MPIWSNNPNETTSRTITTNDRTTRSASTIHKLTMGSDSARTEAEYAAVKVGVKAWDQMHQVLKTMVNGVKTEQEVLLLPVSAIPSKRIKRSKNWHQIVAVINTLNAQR